MKIKKRDSRKKEVKDLDIDFDCEREADWAGEPEFDADAEVDDDEDRQMFHGWDQNNDGCKERWG